jgi:hypothetical protein
MLMSDTMLSGIIGGLFGVLAAIISGLIVLHTTKYQIKASKKATEDQIEAAKQNISKQILLSRSYALRTTIEAKLSYIFTKHTVQTMLENEDELREIWGEIQIYPYVADLNGEPVLGNNLGNIIDSYFNELLKFSKASYTNKKEEINQLRHNCSNNITRALDDFITEKSKQ